LPVRAVLLLPLLLLPPQLLAGEQPPLAGRTQPAVHAAAGVHGVPAVPRAELALRAVATAEVLPRFSLLAGSVLGTWLSEPRTERGGESGSASLLTALRSVRGSAFSRNSRSRPQPNICRQTDF